jgi:exosortase
LPVGNVTGPISFHLRLLATQITAGICETGLGIDVVHTGTRLLDPQGLYDYEVAAACSGIRSLTATLALATVYAFVMLKVWWRRGLMILSAFPLAVAANVVRLSTIIVVAEAFGQKAGNFVHHSSWLSLLPYVPAIIGILVLGHWLREGRERRKRPEVEMWGGVERV